ncbi:MAG: GNAT family N-acetyltransferase [Candidatus Kapaibacterium sp.]
MEIDIAIASEEHVRFAEEICEMIATAAEKRGTGIARRTPEYISSKMTEGKAVIAFADGRPVGFCYIESWSHGRFVANSGLIVAEECRNSGLARRIKKEIFKLSRKKYPNAKIFSITTSLAVMKLNSELGYRPVTFSELTDDAEFWKGCQSCRNFDILQRNDQRMCLCTGMLYDPEHPDNFNFSKKARILERLRSIKQGLFLKKNGKGNGK